MILGPDPFSSFSNGIRVLRHERENQSNISTLLYRPGTHSITAFKNVPIPFERIQELALQELQNIHPLDWVINPKGWELDLPEWWEDDNGKSILADFIVPAQIYFLSGVRIRPVEHKILRTPSFGQLIPPKEENLAREKAAEVWIGASLRPRLEVTQTDGTFVLTERTGENKNIRRPLLKMVDAITEVQRIATSHELDKQFANHRKEQIDAQLRKIFS